MMNDDQATSAAIMIPVFAFVGLAIVALIGQAVYHTFRGVRFCARWLRSKIWPAREVRQGP